MEFSTHLTQLLHTEGARVFAFDASGSKVISLPDHIRSSPATEIEMTSPLERLMPASQGNAVVAYEWARRTGVGTATIRFEDEDADCRLDVFDLKESDGCFLGVVTATPLKANDALIAELPPRQSVMSLNVSGEVITVSETFERMFGWTADEVVGMSALDYIHPDDHEAGIIGWAALLEKPGTSYRVRSRFKTKAGQWIWCEETDTNHLNDPDKECVIVEIVDITPEIEAQAALQRRETLLDSLRQALPTGVLHLDADGNAALWNDRWLALTGIPGSAGADGLLECAEDREEVKRALNKSMDQRVDIDLPITLLGKGACCFGELHLRPLDEGGTPFGLLITLDDVTRLRSHQLELAEQNRRDPLTGVYNRLGIDEFLESHLDQGRTKCSVLFLDLDDFKSINDSFGHRLGDEVLQTVAAAVNELLRPGDALGRLGGDEFLVVAVGDLSDDDALRFAQRIEIAANLASARFDQPLDVGVSVGYARSKPDDDAETLVSRADHMMYERKQQRRGAPPADDVHDQPHREDAARSPRR